MDFTDELQALLDRMTSEGDSYYSTVLADYTGDIEHVATKMLDRHRWAVTQLDVYRRKADGALAGIFWESPATEEQECDRAPVVVQVEAYTRTDYRTVN
jgi:hypothetical protein